MADGTWQEGARTLATLALAVTAFNIWRHHDWAGIAAALVSLATTWALAWVTYRIAEKRKAHR